MATLHFTTDYPSILKKIKEIDPLQYAKTRNFINGSVSYLSPYISRGVISLKQVQQEVINKGFGLEITQKFLQELAWREYYQRIWQVKEDLIWEDLKQPQPDFSHQELMASVINAEMGINAIDQQIKNLYHSGYMHNHVRMYVASIVCNIGKTHWLQPSKWLYYHLLDGDIASNTASWQWVSGAFASKKYYCNQENINKYTGSDQLNTFLDKTYEELPTLPVPDELKERMILQLKTPLPETPFPTVDLNKPTLIYNSYNLDPVWRSDQHVNRVLLLEPSHFLKYPVSEKVMNFIIDLSKNLPGIQIYTGEISDLTSLYENSRQSLDEFFISKAHPAFGHYPGVKDSYDWMFPEVTGEYPSFFKYWKKCKPYLDQMMEESQSL